MTHEVALDWKCGRNIVRAHSRWREVWQKDAHLAAGLAAARQLRASGHKVVILEGNARAGGRVYTKRLEVRASPSEDLPLPCFGVCHHLAVL